MDSSLSKKKVRIATLLLSSQRAMELMLPMFKNSPYICSEACSLGRRQRCAEVLFQENVRVGNLTIRWKWNCGCICNFNFIFNQGSNVCKRWRDSLIFMQVFCSRLDNRAEGGIRVRRRRCSFFKIVLGSFGLLIQKAGDVFCTRCLLNESKIVVVTQVF